MKSLKMLVTLLSVLCMCNTIPVQTEAAKPNIDIYLIAGQSNAAGKTMVNERELAALDSRYVEGFEHILYAGSAGNLNVNPIEYDIQKVKIGLGAGDRYMGPEVGMAEALSEYYNPKTGAYAGFIKYAVGGTSLLYTGGKDWASPSYKETLTETKDTTGYYYNEFIDEVKQRMEEFEEAGFEPVIKGLYWMQGEKDRAKTKEYTTAFKYFAEDVRDDLTKATGQSLQNMPILIGEISRTFESASAADIKINNAFIAAQRKLPDVASDCYIIPSSEYDMNFAESIVGSDNAHWNYKDCLTIGNLVGECFEELYFSTEHTHTYDRKVAEEKYIKSAGTCTKKAVYYKSCECGAKSNSEIFEGRVSHTYGEWKVIWPATALTKGTQKRTCEKCGEVQIEKIARNTADLEHKHIYNQEVEDAEYLKEIGTCTRKAVYYKSCSCGEASDTKTFKGSKKSHTYGEYTVLKEATETETGLQERTCSVCQYVETTTIPALGSEVNETPVVVVPGRITTPWIVLLIAGGILTLAAIGIGVVGVILSKKNKKSEEEKEK